MLSFVAGALGLLVVVLIAIGLKPKRKAPAMPAVISATPAHDETPPQVQPTSA